MRRLLGLTLAAAMIGLAGCGEDKPGTDYSQEKLTEAGNYWVTWSSTMDPVMAEMNMDFTISVYQPDQTSLLPTATLVADGRTTQHGGHGMPTSPPTVTANGDGTFTVGPMHFSHDGDWFVDVEATNGGVTDMVTFTVNVHGEGHEH